MKQKLGNWILDVAKYITTVGLIAPFLSDVASGWTYFGMVCGVAIMLVVGLILSQSNEENNKTNKRR